MSEFQLPTNAMTFTERQAIKFTENRLEAALEWLSGDVERVLAGIDTVEDLERSYAGLLFWLRENGHI